MLTKSGFANHKMDVQTETKCMSSAMSHISVMPVDISGRAASLSRSSRRSVCGGASKDSKSEEDEEHLGDANSGPVGEAAGLHHVRLSPRNMGSLHRSTPTRQQKALEAAELEAMMGESTDCSSSLAPSAPPSPPTPSTSAGDDVKRGSCFDWQPEATPEMTVATSEEVPLDNKRVEDVQSLYSDRFPRPVCETNDVEGVDMVKVGENLDPACHSEGLSTAETASVDTNVERLSSVTSEGTQFLFSSHRRSSQAQMQKRATVQIHRMASGPATFRQSLPAGQRSQGAASMRDPPAVSKTLSAREFIAEATPPKGIAVGRTSRLDERSNRQGVNRRQSA